MIKPDLLAILCCPETHQALKEAAPELVSEINRKIAARQLKNRAGETVTEPIQGGLVRADGKFLYFIRNEIPVLLIDQAAPMA